MHQRCGRFIIMSSSSLSDVLDNNDSIEDNEHAVLIETVVLTSLTSYHANASPSHLLKKERIKVRRENSQLLPADSRKLIDRNEIPHKRVTKEHILSLLGAGLLQGNPAEVESLYVKRYGFVQCIKADLRHFAATQISHLMLEVAVDRKMLFDRRIVNSFRQVLHSWKFGNPTSQQCETIFHVTYGWFDKNRTWNYDMETNFLKSRNMMYIDEASDDFAQLESNLKMGCIARLCAEVKNDIVRQIRKVGLQTHGVKVFRRCACDVLAMCLRCAPKLYCDIHLFSHKFSFGASFLLGEYHKTKVCNQRW